MVIGIIFIIVGFYIARTKKAQKWWLKTHHLLVIIGWLLMVVAFTIAWIMVGSVSTIHFRVLHGYAGITTISLFIIAIILGVVITKIKKQSLPTRKSHRWIARITILIALITVLSGILTAGLL
jgi:heme A synthase